MVAEWSGVPSVGGPGGGRLKQNGKDPDVCQDRKGQVR